MTLEAAANSLEKGWEFGNIAPKVFPGQSKMPFSWFLRRRARAAICFD